MSDLSLNELYVIRDEVSFQLIEASESELVQLQIKLEEIERLIMVREGELASGA